MTELNRRTVLRGVAVTGMIGACPLLAACGGSEETGSGAPRASENPSTPAQSPADSASPSEEGGEVIATTAEIPVGGGKVFPDAQVVVTQPTGGEFLGFTAICTHMGCTVAEVADGTINCPCHGSKFDIADGSVANGPADEPLPKKPVSVEGEEIRLA